MTHKINLVFSLSLGYSIFNAEYSQLLHCAVMNAYNLVMRVQDEEKMEEKLKARVKSCLLFCERAPAHPPVSVILEENLPFPASTPDAINSPGTVQQPYRTQ